MPGSPDAASDDAYAEIREAKTADLLEGIREILSAAHEGRGTANGEPLDSCPGCWAQAAVDELAMRYA